MTTVIHERVELARAGKNPTVICRAPSGWMVLCDAQYLRGYSILLSDPIVPDLNALDTPGRVEFLRDMTILGDALLEVTGAYRINYAVLGNLDPVLHAHVIPRYMTEPEEFRAAPPWNYPKSYRDSIPFDFTRDQELIKQLAEAVKRRL